MPGVSAKQTASDKKIGISIEWWACIELSLLMTKCLFFIGAIDPDLKNEQVLDKLQVERERGITVKAQTASLFYDYDGETYLLNLIDTPVRNV